MIEPPTAPSARDRIRDAALVLFATRGVAATPVRAVAEHAGVSTALVMHHFGSKDNLRVACDEHVAATVREQKNASVSTGADPLAALRAAEQGPPLLRYLARTLIDGSPHVATLVDEMAADAQAYTEAAVDAGICTPSDLPRERAVVLTLWSLGALVLHEHLDRLLGVDITGDPAQMGAYAVPATELLSRGVITEDYYRRVREGFAALPSRQRDEPPVGQPPHPQEES